MREYEIMYILEPTLNKDEIQTTRGELENIITSNGGTLLEEDVWGLKDLAYEINKHKQGYFVIIYIKAPTKAISEFDRLAKINKKRLRHMIINVEMDAIKEAKTKFNEIKKMEEELKND